MDMEKVIKGLECLAQKQAPTANPCKDCGYINRPSLAICMKDIASDALELLKEQEAQIKNREESLEKARQEIKWLRGILKEQKVVLAHWDDDTGHWIEGDRNGIDQHTRTTGEMIDTFRCSWCGFYQYWKTPFCPNCGAKMEGR